MRHWVLNSAFLSIWLFGFPWAFGQSGLPPKPIVQSWIRGSATLVVLEESDSRLAIIPRFQLEPRADGGFLYGVTPGYDVEVEPDGVTLRAHGSRRSEKIRGPGRRKMGFSYPNGKVIQMPVDFLEDAPGNWMWRIPVLLRVSLGSASAYFVDGDGDGWFDDCEVDLIAVATRLGDDLQFASYQGEIRVPSDRPARGGGGSSPENSDRRHLAFIASPQDVRLWPVSPGARGDYVRAVADINAARRFAGLEPVGFAEELTPLCEAHSQYCGGLGIVEHEEDPARPGYTPGGAHAGMRSLVSTSPGNARPGIRSQLETLWHRNKFYSHSLTRVGVGWSSGVVTVDVLSWGMGTEGRTATLLVPPDRSLDAATGFTDIEIPNPYPGEVRQGPFISVLLTPGQRVRFLQGSITSREGETVAFDVTDPMNPPPGADSLVYPNDASIVLIPHERLRPDSIYDVNVVAGGGGGQRRFQWSFRSGSR